MIPGTFLVFSRLPLQAVVDYVLFVVGLLARTTTTLLLLLDYCCTLLDATRARKQY